MSEAKRLSVEERLAALEAEVARLRAQVGGNLQSEPSGWDQIWGSFANDPLFEEAMRLGREYRESLRPKPRKKRMKRNVGARHGSSLIVAKRKRQ